MRLSRRDALVALGATGLAGVGVATGVLLDDAALDEATDEDLLPTLVGAAEVLYPSDVDGVEAFVATYSLGRLRGREAYREGVVAAVRAVDEAAREWYDGAFADLDATTRESILREMGTDVAAADPDGSRAERVRYYVVNELLYAFYASPTGGDLAGIENPPGYPGGTESYRRGPGRGHPTDSSPDGGDAS
ncbi:gluconate 2-dehydrogenase subunit 3 family protein [Halomarina oriensis]|uniref:Gluconate 2-dehydrogenase subunit 3 family protein n=1 Tax=Halomarina oriensis TaxID=671145 RepID=A0A6B0GVJ0_9EURY|nr:gluconate 2-dehydrogenase subunit 3 family protein [Halomarina oriensis]MWG35728.1 gluconate 2-dehydrogenase subunit 3 family protein [Halomarina oriensis]